MNIKYLLLLTLSLFALQLSAQDFDFFDTEEVQEIRISTSEKNWRSILDSLRINGDDALSGAITINGKKYQDIGFRYAASRAFTPGKKRHSFHIQLNYKKDQTHQSHETVQLSSALRDPSLVRQVMTHEIAGVYLPTPRANYANLYVNNEYCGLFINVEPIDNAFLQQHYGSAAGTLIESTPAIGARTTTGCQPNAFAGLQYEQDVSCYEANFSILKGERWDGLTELTRTLKDDLDNIERVLDVEETLWMLAINNVLVNLRSYTGKASQNYYLYQDEAGVFHPILGATNFSFGSYKNTGLGSDLPIKQLQRLSPLLHAEEVSKPLIKQLLKNDTYQRQYLSNVRTILQEFFWNGAFNKRVKKLRARIRFLLESDEYKYYSLEEFNKSSTTVIGRNSKVPGIVSFMSLRSDYLKKHPTMTILPPRITEINIAGREQFASQKVAAFDIQVTTERFPRSVKLYYRFDAASAFQSSEMLDDGKGSDAQAKDGIFSLKVTPPKGQEKLEYYFLIENAKAINYAPARYRKEYYTTSLQELNE
ncbi:MAG: CotH kinase family protein [Bacteroidota bacterium]